MQQQKKACLVRSLFELSASAQSLSFETLDILADNPNAVRIQTKPVSKADLHNHTENFLSSLERVAILWDLLDKNKYRHRL